MKANSESMERIISAADSLFEQAGRAAFPSVDAVRKLARVNMNDASSAMKEWRRNQLGRTLPVPVRIPDAVQRIHADALAALWLAAQETAGEALASLSAAWDVERAELEQLNREMADAFETQAIELRQACNEAQSQSEQASKAEARCGELSAEFRAEQGRRHAEWERMAQTLVSPYIQQMAELKTNHAQERRRLREKLQSAYSQLHESQVCEAVMRGKYEESKELYRQSKMSSGEAISRTNKGGSTHRAA